MDFSMCLNNFYYKGKFYKQNEFCKQETTKQETLQQLEAIKNSTWDSNYKKQVQQIIDIIKTK